MANLRKLENQKYDDILAHILNPEKSPLTPALQIQFDRVMQASRLLDRHPDQSQVASKLQAKYRIGRNTAYQDIRLARELFKMNNEFDYDFWKAWQIKDILELIRECKLQGKHKEWVNAHKVLRTVIGEKPIEDEDPHRAEKTNVYIQLNNNYSIPVSLLHKLSKADLAQLSQAAFVDIDDAEAEEIMNS